MDPLTLFALANTAVSAVKAGCKLYKDIKGAAGDIKDVLKDLDAQWAKLHPPDKPATTEQRNQYVKTRNEVVNNNKKANANEHTGIYTEIGNHLGAYFDNYYKCLAIFEEEEKKSKTQVYTGDDSLGKRALQHVLMKKQLEQMSAELREIMIYQSPKELGALWTDVNDMMVVMGKQQKALFLQQVKQHEINDRKANAKKKRMREYAMWGVGFFICFLVFVGTMLLVAESRKQMYPQYGVGFFPETEEERIEKLKPKQYIGR